MPSRHRDYAAEYRQRVARGAERGLSKTQAYGHPRRGEARAGQVLPEIRERFRRAVEKQTRRTAAGDITKTRSAGVLRQALLDAAAAGGPVSILATFTTVVGPRQRWIDSPRALANLGEGGEGSHRGVGPAVPIGAVQVVTGPAVAAGGGGGVDPQDVLDLVDDEGVYGALYLLWDAMGEQSP